MFRVPLLLFLFFAFLNYSAFAQRSVTHQKMLWTGYNGKYNFSPKWSGSFELDERRTVDPSFQQAMILPRVMLIRKMNNGWNGGIGFTYYLKNTIINPVENSLLTVPELRVHQQAEYRQLIKHLEISHRYKLEERWIHKSAVNALAPGYDFSFRGRYKFQADYPVLPRVSKEGSLKIKIYNEIFLNFGNKKYPVFDQNRFYIAINYSLLKNLQIEAGYLKIFKQLNNTDSFMDSDCLRISFYHTIDFFH